MITAQHLHVVCTSAWYKVYPFTQKTWKLKQAKEGRYSQCESKMKVTHKEELWYKRYYRNF